MKSQHFQDALRVEVATLQAAHPILAEQLARAHALICDGKVWSEDDGKTAMVQSSTDPALWYSVNGHCQCKAHEFRPEPCKHRMAKRLYERVCDRLAAEEERWTIDLDPDEVPPPAPLPEAPASVNVRVTVAGREVQWTLRGTDETRLAERLDALLQRYPVEEGSALVSTKPPQTPTCRFHGPMKPSAKAAGTFYCTRKLHDGSYCGERFPATGGH
jgi:hypothetical protein